MAPTNEETLIFVDVDGVLNVGIHDEGKAPLLLRDEDVATAIKLAKRGYKGPEASCVEKLSSLATQQVGFNENGTYEKLMTRQGAEVADLLVERLAKVILRAGDCKVILSSSWRRPHHRNRRRLLENRIAHHLGKPFQFHASTPLREERTAADRLEAVGDYVAEYSRDQKGPLRILMFEDFFITPMEGWRVRGEAISSVASAERALQRRAPEAVVKICHCYDEVVCGHLKMQVGTGLTQRLFEEATNFVSAGGSVLPLVKALDKVEEKLLNSEEQGFVSTMLSAFVPPMGSMVHAF